MTVSRGSCTDHPQEWQNLNINHDFIFNNKILYTTLIICLLNHIVLNFYKIILNN